MNIKFFINMENALRLILTRIPNIKISKKKNRQYPVKICISSYIYKKILAQMVTKYMAALRLIPINFPGNYPCLHSANEDLMKFTLFQSWNLFSTSLTLKAKFTKPRTHIGKIVLSRAVFLQPGGCMGNSFCGAALITRRWIFLRKLFRHAVAKIE